EGIAEPRRASLVCGVYAVTALLVNLRWQRLSLSYAGQGLFLAATLWAPLASGPGRSPWWGTVLAIEALALAALAVWRSPMRQDDGRVARRYEVLTAPCHNVAWLAGSLALLLALSAWEFFDSPSLTLTAFTLAVAVWLLVWVNGQTLGTWL